MQVRVIIFNITKLDWNQSRIDLIIKNKYDELAGSVWSEQARKGEKKYECNIDKEPKDHPKNEQNY